MAYIGRGPTNSGEFIILDDISSGFDGSDTSFTLTVGTTEVTPAAANVTIALDGVIQTATSAYSVTGSTINFTEAPASGQEFHGVLAGQSQYISDSSITNQHISGTANISGSKISTDFSAQVVKARVFDGMISGSDQIAASDSMTLATASIAAITASVSRIDSEIDTNAANITLATASIAAITASLGQPVNTDSNVTFGDITSTGTITATEIHTTFVSSSIAVSSGSNNFGDESSDHHSFTGSVSISGSSSDTSLISYGNVGINTVNPVRPLGISYGKAKTDTNVGYAMSIQSNESSGQAALQFYAVGGASAAARKFQLQTTEVGVANAGIIEFQPDGGVVSFANNVGIGTDNPLANLHIHHVDGDADAGPILRLQRDNSASEDNGDILGEIQFIGSDSANDATEYSTIHSKISNVSNTVEEGTIVFKNMVAGSSTSVMNIVGSKVGIGDTAPSSPLEVSAGSGAGQGSIGYNGTLIAASSASAQEYSDSNSATWGPKVSISNETASSTRTAASLVFAHRNSSSGVAAIVSTNAATDRADLRFITRGAGNVVGERMRLTDDGTLIVGDVSNANMTQGLTINQGTNDDEILTFKSSDVAHGVTARTETDTYGFIKKSRTDEGGVFLGGYTELDIGITLDATSTSDITDKNTGANGNILVRARKKDGTGDGQVGSNANLMVIENYDATRFIFDAEGDFHADNSSTTFDQYNDAQLVRAYDLSHGRGVIQSKFDDFVNYQHETLASLKLVGREKDGTPNNFVNVTGMQRLHNGAIWQQYTEMEKMKELMYDTMVQLLGKETADKKLEQHDIKLLDESLDVTDSLWSRTKNKVKSLFKVVKN